MTDEPKAVSEGKADAQFHRFTTWLRSIVKPAMINFVDDNKGVAMEVVLQVATDFAGKPKELKFKTAAERLGNKLIERSPDIKFRSSWISLLIELALVALKANGQIK